MRSFTNVKISNDILVDMLVDRLDYWKKSRENKDLFEKMYENAVYEGLFEGAEFDVNVIVDNDVANWCCVIDERDEEFNKVLKLYKDGEYDISCETNYSYIEAVSDDETRILVRC